MCCSPWCCKELDRAERLNWKTYPTRLPGEVCLTPPGAVSLVHHELPQGVLKVNSCRSVGFSLHRGRWQIPFSFSCLQRSWQVLTVVDYKYIYICVCVCIMEYYSAIKMRKSYCAIAAICIHSKGIIFQFVHVSQLRIIQWIQQLLRIFG